MSESFFTMSEDKGLFELIIEHILFVLRCCRNNDVINDCLSLTDTLLAWRLDAFTTNIDALRGSSFSFILMNRIIILYVSRFQYSYT